MTLGRGCFATCLITSVHTMGPTWLPSIGKASLLLEYLTTFEDVNESSAAYTQTLLSTIGFTEIIPPQGGY